MNKELKTKYNKLKTYLAALDEIVVAYSGGVDSTLLLKVAKDLPGIKVSAIIGKSPSTPEKEFNEALIISRKIGVEPFVLETNELKSRDYCENSMERCYHCKKVIFGNFIKQIKELGLKNLVDGSNYDDLNDFRPGSKALNEFGVISPFVNSRMTKNDIRELSKELGLTTWNKEAMACLATRISYGEPITVEKLKMIEKAEEYLRELGFTYVRARLSGNHLRIESSTEELTKFFVDDIRRSVIKKMKEIGFKYISIDMEGYRMGSMNG